MEKDRVIHTAYIQERTMTVMVSIHKNVVLDIIPICKPLEWGKKRGMDVPLDC